MPLPFDECVCAKKTREILFALFERLQYVSNTDMSVQPNRRNFSAGTIKIFLVDC
jgi:hypothetical protein